MNRFVADSVIGFNCVRCGASHYPAEVQYTCSCDSEQGILDIDYQYDEIRKNVSRADLASSTQVGMWRYLPLLPVPDNAQLPSLVVGNTPLYALSGLAHQLDLKQVWCKDESRQPSGSLKDRASAMAVVHARLAGYDTLATASTGNAAAALSCLAANMSMRAKIYVPKDAPKEKLLQIQAYGAEIVLVDGNYDAAFKLSLTEAKENHWYIRNTAYNPYMTEGKKTVAYEIAEQLNWQMPDIIAVSVGDGSIIGGVHKGLKDLLALGWIEKMPRILGVQASGSDFIYQAWHNRETVLDKAAIAANSVADSLQADLPKDRVKALNAVVQTGGIYTTVTDEEILQAMNTLGRHGILSEPAAAATLAGITKARKDRQLEAHESLVMINTGTGLKDMTSIQKMLKSYGSENINQGKC